jgi:subtilase family serine protease
MDCLDSSLLAAVNTAISSGASVVTDSWGDALGDLFVDAATKAAFDNTFLLADTTGVSVLFSSGDSGDNFADFGMTVPDYPPTSPLVTAVGGTSLAIGQTGNLLFEVGWETGAAFLNPAVVADGGTVTTPPTWDAVPFFVFGAGGGWSSVFEQPKWQKGVVPDSFAVVSGVARRSVPDVGMLADPFTGFVIGQTDPGTGTYSEFAIGGTSLACPLFAATIAVAQQHAKKKFGFVNPLLYKHPGAFRDIVPVNPAQAVALPLSDGSVAAVSFDYPAQTIKTGAGWDSVTGLGAPNGQAFLNAIK